jgi:hypothetical protein
MLNPELAENPARISEVISQASYRYVPAKKERVP